jgi:hypothetical protein
MTTKRRKGLLNVKFTSPSPLSAQKEEVNVVKSVGEHPFEPLKPLEIRPIFSVFSLADLHRQGRKQGQPK